MWKKQTFQVSNINVEFILHPLSLETDKHVFMWQKIPKIKNKNKKLKQPKKSLTSIPTWEEMWKIFLDGKKHRSESIDKIF